MHSAAQFVPGHLGDFSHISTCAQQKALGRAPTGLQRALSELRDRATGLSSLAGLSGVHLDWEPMLGAFSVTKAPEARPSVTVGAGDDDPSSLVPRFPWSLLTCPALSLLLDDVPVVGAHRSLMNAFLQPEREQPSASMSVLRRGDRHAPGRRDAQQHALPLRSRALALKSVGFQRNRRGRAHGCPIASDGS